MGSLAKEPRNDPRNPRDMRADEIKAEIPAVEAWLKAAENGTGAIDRDDAFAYHRQKTRLAALRQALGFR